MKTFVIHYTPLINRKKLIDEQLLYFNINPLFITQFDRDHLINEQLNIFEEKKINSAEISYFYKQLECYQIIIKEKISIALIFDDDVLLDDDFINKTNSYIKQLPNNWDVCYLSDICNFHIPDNIINNNTPNVFLKNNNHEILNGTLAHGSTRGPAYLINYAAALKIYNIFNHYRNNNIKINKAHDHWLNDVFRELNFNVYWAEPSIVRGGSEIGFYKTSLHNYE